MTTKTVALAIGVALIANLGVAQATDVPIASKKLVISGKVIPGGRAKATFVGKDAAITKGVGTDPTQISAELDVSYRQRQRRVPRARGDRLAAQPPPSPSQQRVGAHDGLREDHADPARQARKAVGEELGDTPIDISAPPTGSVLAVYTVTNARRRSGTAPASRSASTR